MLGFDISLFASFSKAAKSWVEGIVEANLLTRESLLLSKAACTALLHLVGRNIWDDDNRKLPFFIIKEREEDGGNIVLVCIVALGCSVCVSIYR